MTGRIALTTVTVLYVALAAGIVVHSSRSPASFVLALAFFLLPFCAALAATGQVLRSTMVGAATVLVVHLLARMKVHYYKETLVASDMYLIGDPSNSGTLLRYPFAGVAVLMLVALFAWALLAHRDGRRLAAWVRWSSLATAAVFLTACVGIGRDADLRDAWLRTLPKGQGTFADLVFSAGGLSYSPPSFAGDERIFLGRRPVSRSRGGDLRPDIVVWLQESTVDPRIYDLPGATPPVLAMFQPHPTTRAQGWLRVPTVGGGTWMSEFALLSGLATRDFGLASSAVYYTVTPHLKTSLVKVLKKSGYRTVVLTPFNKSAYHSGPAYTDFGFDEIVQPQDLGYPADPSDNLWTIESRQMAGYAKEILERQSAPIFLFMFSMKEHGPYDAGHAPAYGLDRAAGDRQFAGRVSDYFGRIEALSAATQEFSDAVLGRARPTLFLYFGDHQPNLGGRSLKYRVSLPQPEYLTQFVLRDNLAGPAAIRVGEVTELAFVGGLLLERSGVKPDALFEANIAMRKLCQGRLQDCPDSQLVQSYKHYVYDLLGTASLTGIRRGPKGFSNRPKRPAIAPPHALQPPSSVRA